jgi:hypothetical protein
MLSVLQQDTSAFAKHSEEFIALLLSVIGTDRITVEHKYVSALFAVPAFRAHPLFDGVPALDHEMKPEDLFEMRFNILDGKLGNDCVDASSIQQYR